MDSSGKFDTDRFINGATQRLYSSLHIEEALHSTTLYLKDFLPLDMINAGITDESLLGLRYLAVATSERGYLVDERIRLTPQAVKDARTFKVGAIKIDNCISSNRAVAEAAAHMISPCLPFSPTGQRDGFSTMTLVIGMGKKMTAYFNLVAFGRNRYTDLHRDRLMLIERPLTGAMLNLIHYREVLNRNEKLEKANEDLRNRLGHTASRQLIGAESGLRAVMEKVRSVASTDTPVLLTGETGTGKELIAHAIHGMSGREKHPIVCINCGAIPESLVDSELFGHEKGAFTGASELKRGYFEQADGGTIFLDEVADLPSPIQVKLLRVLQEKTFYRVGGERPISVDARVIAATHNDISKMVVDGRFRNDLWFRLNVFPIHLPPIRERREDIPEMARLFALTKAAEMNIAFRPEFAGGAMGQLQAYDWPGNIRELQNLVERSLILCHGEPLAFPELSHVSPETETPFSPESSSRYFPCLDDLVISHIREALLICNSKIEGVGGAAELLGLNPSTLRGKMRKYGITASPVA